ncbi:MAG: AI-2E family transporter [Fibrobacterota bacterium]
MPPPGERHKRAKIVYTGSFILFSAVGLSLIIALRSLILPSIIGALTAYICLPVLTYFKRRNIPRGFGIIFLVGGFFLFLSLLGTQLTKILPDEKGQLEIQTRVQYKANEKYEQFMGLDSTAKGNFIYNLLGRDFDAIMKSLNNMLALGPGKQDLFKKYASGYRGTKPIDPKYISYFEENLARSETMELKNSPRNSAADGEKTEKDEASPEKGVSILGTIADVASLWIVMPFVFLFLLIDDGQIKKYLVKLIPNKYFEVGLTVIDNVDEAIGNYLRGTILECSLVGLTFIVCLLLIGVSPQWAVIIGVVAGTANAIPFLGPAIGLVVGIIYAFIAEDVNSILPFMNENNLFIGVLITVAIAQGLDNAVFQPIVLGRAVNLHPLIVVLGVMGGSVIFGFLGMLFAIPTIVILKVIIETLFTQLKAYYII